jgi:hypothetical protein
MSKRTIEGFFPGFLQYIIRPIPVVRGVYEDVLFPDSVAELCPEVVLQFQFRYENDDVVVMMVRQPALAISATLGCIIGVYGGSIVLLRAKNQNKQSFLLSLSLLSFGLMNFAGLFLHCLFSNPGSSTTTYPEAAPWTWMMDCYMTGVSATAFILASLQDVQTMLSTRNLLIWCMCVNLIGVACVMSFFHLDATFPLELWYLLPVLLTVPVAPGAFFGPSLGSCKSLKSLSRRQVTALACLALGGLSIIAGLHLDATFCRWFGDSYYDALTVTNMIFLGCDLAFLGIVLWVQGKDDSTRRRDDSRKRA